MTLPVTAQAALVATLVDEWERAGLTDAVISPGSRSTPLTAALAASRLRTHVHIDERSAAFFALGLGLASGRPAPVITTSGSAAAHLLPAVMEASHAGVPMVVCTADRPRELHHVGAPQTTAQDALFEPFVRLQLTIDDAMPADSWRSIAARVVADTGPVHLNLQLREPLVASPGELVPAGRPDGRPWQVVNSPGPQTVALRTPVSGRAGLIVATADIADPSLVLETAAALGWPILAGPRSGLRGPGQRGIVVSAFDSILRHPGTAEALRPDVVLRLGGLPASKVTNAWLDELDADQIVADPRRQWIDPGRTASEMVVASPEAVCRSVTASGAASAPDGWAAAWRTAETTAQQTIETVLATHSEPTEPGVARAVTRALPADATLLVASSMPIRDVEWYGHPAMVARAVANRGLNGIDGMVSTALGLAAASSPTVALLGDLAFLHDSGGLVGASARGLDCTFVVVDNDGGGIFSFLPQAATFEPARFERFWGTPPGVDLAALAGAHGLAVTAPAGAAEVAGAVTAAIDAGGVRVVVLKTDRRANVAVHDELTAAVCAALGADDRR